VESTEISVPSRWTEWNSTCSTWSIWISPGFHLDSMWNHLESMGEGKVLPMGPKKVSFIVYIYSLFTNIYIFCLILGLNNIPI
jgi:hypothetical protein